LLKSFSLKYPQSSFSQFEFLYVKENWNLGKCDSSDERFDRAKLVNSIELVESAKIPYSTYQYFYMIEHILYNGEYSIVAGKFYGMEVATLYKIENDFYKSITRVDNSKTGWE
jgi:hypothetical protein